MRHLRHAEPGGELRGAGDAAVAAASSDTARKSKVGHARGQPVIPCNADKSPRGKWKAIAATTATIDSWFSTGLTHYGVRTDNLTIIDVDVKRDAEQGIADYLALGELPPTFTVLTPSGGFHKYFAGRSRKTKIGDCIDVQSGDGAQCIGPGSPGYRVLEDLPLAPLPDHLAEVIGRPRETAAVGDTSPMREPDQPDAMRDGWGLVAATAGLAESEGKGRNATAHALAGHLKRLGVSESTCTEMVTAWGAKCSPVLEPDEVSKVVGSSYANGDWRIGEARPDGEFDRIDADVAAIKPTGLVSRLASEIEPRAIEWLWYNRFPLGKCALTAGDGDLGKTTLLLGMIATVTRGGDWPAGEGTAQPGNVIYFSTEDDAQDTIIPRLMAAGADRSRIRIVTAVKRTDNKGDRAFDLAADLAKLEAEIRRTGNVRLVVFDPISAYFGKADTYRNSEVRAVLGPAARASSASRT